MRPPLVKQDKPILFTNLEAQLGQPDNQQVWHSITSCKAPCNRGSGIGYPLANGPVKFDSGQLGYGTPGGGDHQYERASRQGRISTRRRGSPKAGKTYTYFCRIHPFMRGSVRVKKPKNKN